ncbi:MAG: F0F1 ATP synthase subunit delta, partial [Gammaproteobacteria bacterium]|nr:F0F1 ATP synthase subunit delta [Gammaproteobacteria bacterium]
MVDNNTIARPYAQAAFELAHESGELATWSDGL